MPSAISLLKCSCVSSALGCTMGRGGMVLASRRCILVLKASGTGFPRWRVLPTTSHTPFIWDQGKLRDSGSLRSSESSIARRKAVLNSSRKPRASAISSDSVWRRSWITFRASIISSRIS